MNQCVSEICCHDFLVPGSHKDCSNSSAILFVDSQLSDEDLQILPKFDNVVLSYFASSHSLAACSRTAM